MYTIIAFDCSLIDVVVVVLVVVMVVIVAVVVVVSSVVVVDVVVRDFAVSLDQRILIEITTFLLPLLITSKTPATINAGHGLWAPSVIRKGPMGPQSSLHMAPRPSPHERRVSRAGTRMLEFSQSLNIFIQMTSAWESNVHLPRAAL